MAGDPLSRSSPPSPSPAAASGMGDDSSEKQGAAYAGVEGRLDDGNVDIEGATRDYNAEFSSGSASESEKRAKDAGEAGDDGRPDTRGEGEAGAPALPGRDADTESVADRVLSRISTRSSFNPGPPPDGGMKAWLVVLGVHMVVMNTWGVINSFGIFQTHYATLLDRPPSDIAWIGSFEIFLLFFVGTFAGRLTDAGYFRALLAAGTGLVALGTFTTSACREYWQFFLAQGLCVGLGNGCLFCPSVSVTSTYFERRRSVAIGIGACGSATGGLVFPALVRELLPRIGFGWTMRVVGFVQLVGFAVAFATLKPRIPPRRAGALVEWAAFKETEYVFYAAGAFMCFLGVYFPFFFLSSYGRDVEGMSYVDSLNLLLLLNGVGTVGRILPNYLADKFGPVTMFVPMAGVSGLMVYCWAAVGSPAGLYGWAAVYGMTAGGVQSLFPAALTSLTTDLRKTGTRMGMVFTIVSFSVLIGTPVCGAIISAAGGSFVGAQVFGGSCLAAGTGFLVVAREVKRRKAGEQFWVKV